MRQTSSFRDKATSTFSDLSILYTVPHRLLRLHGSQELTVADGPPYIRVTMPPPRTARTRRQVMPPIRHSTWRRSTSKVHFLGFYTFAFVKLLYMSMALFYWDIRGLSGKCPDTVHMTRTVCLTSWKLFRWLRRPQLWATGHWQLHLDKGSTLASRLT